MKKKIYLFSLLFIVLIFIFFGFSLTVSASTKEIVEKIDISYHNESDVGPFTDKSKQFKVTYNKISEFGESFIIDEENSVIIESTKDNIQINKVILFLDDFSYGCDYQYINSSSGNVSFVEDGPFEMKLIIDNVNMPMVEIEATRNLDCGFGLVEIYFDVDVYSIDFNDTIDGGNISNIPTNAGVGELVEFKVNADSDKRAINVNVYNKIDNSFYAKAIRYNMTTYQFEMPDFDVYVSCEFEETKRDLIITKLDGSPAIEGTKDDHKDFYYDNNPNSSYVGIHVYATDLVFSGSTNYECVICSTSGLVDPAPKIVFKDVHIEQVSNSSCIISGASVCDIVLEGENSFISYGNYATISGNGIVISGSGKLEVIGYNAPAISSTNFLSIAENTIPGNIVLRSNSDFGVIKGESRGTYLPKGIVYLGSNNPFAAINEMNEEIEEINIAYNHKYLLKDEKVAPKALITSYGDNDYDFGLNVTNETNDIIYGEDYIFANNNEFIELYIFSDAILSGTFNYGYMFINTNKITLNNFSMDLTELTTDSYGLNLANFPVELTLVGNNSIKTKNNAITAYKDLTIKGDGKLEATSLNKDTITAQSNVNIALDYNGELIVHALSSGTNNAIYSSKLISFENNRGKVYASCVNETYSAILSKLPIVLGTDNILKGSTITDDSIENLSDAIFSTEIEGSYYNTLVNNEKAKTVYIEGKTLDIDVTGFVLDLPDGKTEYTIGDEIGYTGTATIYEKGTTIPVDITEWIVKYYKVVNSGSDVNYEEVDEDEITAGLYRMVISPTNGYYNGGMSIDFKVNKILVIINIDNKTKKVSEADPEFTFTCEGLDSSLYSLITLSRASGDSEGEYEIDATIDSSLNDNYEFTINKGKLTIEKDPSGEDPSGDDPSGDDPSGDDPSGEDPSGDEPIKKCGMHWVLLVFTLLFIGFYACWYTVLKNKEFKFLPAKIAKKLVPLFVCGLMLLFVLIFGIIGLSNACGACIAFFIIDILLIASGVLLYFFEEIVIKFIQKLFKKEKESEE